MNILCRNSNGAGNADFRCPFREMKNSYNPYLIILTKTRLSGDHATAIISSQGYEHFFKVDAMGFSGGIWILWNPINIVVELITSTFHEVYLRVQVHSSTFLLTALYASVTNAIRRTI